MFTSTAWLCFSLSACSISGECGVCIYSVYLHMCSAIHRQLCLQWLFVCLQTYPTYYEVIKDPIDLRAIARKVQANAYSSLDDLCADIFLLVQNTKSFNEPGSIIYRVGELLL